MRWCAELIPGLSLFAYFSAYFRPVFTTQRFRKKENLGLALHPCPEMEGKWISVAGLVLVGVAVLTLASVRDHRNEVAEFES